jgi:hypothetical protein
MLRGKAGLLGILVLLVASSALAQRPSSSTECIYKVNPKTKTISSECNGILSISLTKDEREALQSGRASWCHLTRGPGGSRRECR